MPQKITALTWNEYTNGLEPQEHTLGDIFYCAGSDFKHLSGKPYRLIRVLDNPDTDPIDPELAPMFEIEVDGERTEAFLDEVEPHHPEFKDFGLSINGTHYTTFEAALEAGCRAVAADDRTNFWVFESDGVKTLRIVYQHN